MTIGSNLAVFPNNGPATDRSDAVGLDVALEALSNAWRGRRLDLDGLNRIDKRLLVQHVMQPYLEAVVL